MSFFSLQVWVRKLSFAAMLSLLSSAQKWHSEVAAICKGLKSSESSESYFAAMQPRSRNGNSIFVPRFVGPVFFWKRSAGLWLDWWDNSKCQHHAGNKYFSLSPCSLPVIVWWLWVLTGSDWIKKIESQRNLAVINLPGMEYLYKLASTAAL